MRTRIAAVCIPAVLLLAGCGGGDDGGDAASETPADLSSLRDAFADVTPLEGLETTPAERAFIAEISSTLSRPYWEDTPEVMIAGYQVCSATSPGQAEVDLSDDGWSTGDAQAFIAAAAEHLC